MELSDVLSDVAPSAPPAAEPPAPPAEAPAAQPPAAAAPAAQAAPAEPARGPDGKFVTKPAEAPASPPPAAPTEEMTPREKAAFAAAQDERRKRQALEAEVAKYRQAQPPAQPGEKPKTFWDDPEGALKAHEARISEKETNILLNTTERLARSRYQDFDEKVEVFAELAKSTPGLAAQMLAAPDPAEFAYTTGKNHQLLKQAGSVDALIEKARKETEVAVRAKVEAEFKAKEEALAKERAAIPGSLSDTRGSAAPAKAVFTGPTPLGDILTGK